MCALFLYGQYEQNVNCADAVLILTDFGYIINVKLVLSYKEVDIMKKFLSLLLGGVLSISAMVSAGTSAIANDTDETGGFTLGEIEASEIKPVLSVSVDDIKGGKVFDLADAAGKKVHVKLDVKGANKKYCSTQIWLFYDASLKIEKNLFGEFDIEKGNALRGLSGSFPEAVNVNETDRNAMSGLFFSSMGQGDYGLDGTMWEFDFVVPADAKAGDVFPIDIRYNYGRGYGMFINNVSDKKGELMSAYAFTKGIYNKTYNNNFTASAENTEKCPALAGIDKSYDAYIAIAGGQPAVTATTVTTSTKSADKLFYGDVNTDGKVSVADAVAILQHLGNRDRYGLKGQGLVNADVDGNAGITGKDALVIQQVDAGIIKAEDLPVRAR